MSRFVFFAVFVLCSKTSFLAQVDPDSSSNLPVRQAASSRDFLTVDVTKWFEVTGRTFHPACSRVGAAWKLLFVLENLSCEFQVQITEDTRTLEFRSDLREDGQCCTCVTQCKTRCRLVCHSCDRDQLLGRGWQRRRCFDTRDGVWT